MTRDRLKEFQELSNQQSVPNESAVTITYEGNDDQKALLELLDKIGPIYKKLKEMMVTVRELRSMVHEHDNRHKVEDRMSKVKADTRKLHSSVNEVKNKSEKSTGIVQHVARTHHLSLVVHLSLLLHELSVMQSDTHNRHAHYVRKELIITGQVGIDEAELESLLDEPAEIFTQNIIRETEFARQQIHDLQERHEAFIKLEKSITEVYQLFQEISILVHDQGETINRIENNVFEAQTKTGKAKEELISAQANQKKTLKKKFICAIIISVALLITLLILIFSFM